MGLLDRAKAAAAGAKKSFDEKNERANAAAAEKENEGLSPEEIAAKDAAKAVITFSKLEAAAYLSYQGGDEFWSNVKNVGKKCEKAQMAGAVASEMGGSGYKDATYYDEPRLRVKFKNESERRMNT